MHARLIEFIETVKRELPGPCRDALENRVTMWHHIAPAGEGIAVLVVPAAMLNSLTGWVEGICGKPTSESIELIPEPGRN
jgi:hypothetical protein